MRATTTVCIGEYGEQEITVKELTVSEVRQVLLTAPSAADPLHALVFDGFGLNDLALMCTASAEDLEALTPSELKPLVEACKDLNPHFFRTRAALAGVARMMLAEAEQIASTAPASP
jgi:hypothetical protein